MFTKKEKEMFSKLYDKWYFVSITRNTIAVCERNNEEPWSILIESDMNEYNSVYDAIFIELENQINSPENSWKEYQNYVKECKLVLGAIK